MAGRTSSRRLSLADALTRADGLILSGHPSAALELIADALSGAVLNRELGARLSAAELYVIERIADVAVQVGQHAAADDLLAAIALAAETAGNIEAADYACLKRAHLLIQGCRTDEAMVLLASLRPRMGALESIRIDEPGLATWEQASGWHGLGSAAAAMLISRAYCVFGALLLDLGRFADAVTILDRAISRLSGSRGEDAAAIALPVLELMRINALLDRGYPREAIAAIEKSGLLAAATASQRMGILEVEGRAALACGEFGSALRAFERIASIAAEAGLHRATLNARLDRCRMLISLNQTVRAEDELQALAMPTAALRDRQVTERRLELLDLIRRRRSSSAAEIDLGMSATAMQHKRGARADGGFNHSRPTLRTFSSFSARFYQAASSVEQSLALGDVRQARAALDDARFRAGRTDSRSIRGHLALLEGQVLLKSGERAVAEQHLRQAVAMLRDLEPGPLLWQALRALSQSSITLSSEERADVRREAERLLDRFTASLDPADRLLYRLNKSTAEDERLSAAVAALTQLKREALACRHVRGWLARWRVRREIARFCFELDRSRGICMQWRDWRRRAGRLARHETLVGYLLLPDAITIFVNRRGRFDMATVATSRVGFQDKLRKWHGNLRAAVNPDRHGYDERETERIGEALARDLRLPDIVGSDVRRLRIVPHGALHAFPFAGCAWDGLPLIARCALVLAPTLVSKPRRRGTVSSALVAAAESGSQRPALPEALGEARDVQRILAEANVRCRQLSGAEATKDGVIIELARRHLAHLACHGTFRPDRPDETGLLLNDGLLDLATIETLDLTSLEHVTLSACSAGDSFILPGDLALSLPTMILAAGAGGVLAALWPIEDRVARCFATRFYGYCRHHSRAEALRRAQLDCTRGIPECDLQAQPPYMWAAFFQMGDGGRLRFGRTLFDRWRMAPRA